MKWSLMLVVCMFVASSLAADSLWHIDELYDYKGVVYQLQSSDPTFGTQAFWALPLSFTGEDAYVLADDSTLKDKYIVQKQPWATMTGLAKTLYVQDLQINWSRSNGGRAGFFKGITNVESIVVGSISINYSASTTVSANQYADYNLAGKLFMGCNKFKLVAFGGNVPILRYIDANNFIVSDVAMDTVQDILWHTAEFYYPSQYSNSWEIAIRKLSYNGKYGAYTGEVFSHENIIPDSGNLKPVESPVITNFVYTTVTNCVTVTNEVFHYSTVTNEVHHYATTTNVVLTYATITNVVKYVPEPGTSPDAGYAIGAGESRDLAIAGVAGWDAFGVPDGMAWDKTTGTLSGKAKLSGTYDVMLVSGSGADTQIMRTTITVAPFDKIVGYVGVAFSQGGAPLDILKSYKTLPAGLKWKDGVLSGVPTKVQTLSLETVDGESVTIEIKPLPDAVVGTFDGCVYFPPSNPTNGVARPCDIIGTVSLTTTAAGKISVSVKTAQKTYSFSATSWTKVENGNLFTLESRMALKTGEMLQVDAYVCDDGESMVLVRLSGGVFGGGIIDAALPGCVTEVVKDIYAKDGGKWSDEAAHALMAKCTGTYLFGFDRVEAPAVGEDVKSIDAWTLRSVSKQEAAFLKVVVKDTGAVTITGTLPDKTKVNCTSKAAASANGVDRVALRIVTAAFSGKTITVPLFIGLMNDGTPIDDSGDCGNVYSVKR